MRITDPMTGREYVRKRRRRFNVEVSARELTFSCYQRFPFLARDRSRTWFVSALRDARDAYGIDLWAWVIMPEHVHLLIAPREPNVDIGGFQGMIKEEVARSAIGWLELHAPHWIPRIAVLEGSRTRRRFWQAGGGYDRNIDNIATLQNVIDYFHLNPVRRGLVDKAINWPWSSAGWYAGIRPAQIEIDSTLPMSYEPAFGRRQDSVE